ncbi:MAG: fumarate hydratase, partial [Thermoplasmata archaeon]|nr:fumarate hydratase [Thermoplasmata archaeon]
MDKGTISSVVVELMRRAHSRLPSDVRRALEEARGQDHPGARLQLDMICEDIDIAAREGVPMCEDSGVPVIYVAFGRVPMDAVDVLDAVREGVRLATDAVPLRHNAVHPLTRINSGGNVGRWVPPVHIDPVDEPYIEITVLAKGAGSENMSALRMLPPVEGSAGVKAFVLETVVKAGGNPCPPIIAGVGIGGTSDAAMALAKRALLRPIDTFNEDPTVAQLEADLRRALYDLGIGPMGLGGRPSVIGVNVEHAHSHPAMLAVGVNVQCWAARRAAARIEPDGRV